MRKNATRSGADQETVLVIVPVVCYYVFVQFSHLIDGGVYAEEKTVN